MTLPEPSYRFTILVDRVPVHAVLRLPGLAADFGVHGYPVADVRQRAPSSLTGGASSALSSRSA